MVQVINDPNRYGLQTGLSEGINSLMHGLASNKLHQVQQQRSAQGLMSVLPHLSYEQARGISALDPKIVEQVVKQKLQEPQQEAFASALSDLLGGAQQQAPQQSMTQEAQLVQQLPQLMQNEEFRNQFSAEEQKYLQDNMQNLAAQAPQQNATKPRLNEKQALELAKLGLKKQEISSKHQESINKETKPYVDEITKSASAAKENDLRLNRMEELIKKGNLRAPFYNNLFDTLSKGILGFGIDLHFLQNADTQEFRKLTHDMLKSAKDTFGSRLTDYDVKTFLASLPSLSQTDEGKERVINNLRIFNDMAKLKKRALDNIIKENNGKRPANIDSLVDEKISSQADKYAERFKRGY